MFEYPCLIKICSRYSRSGGHGEEGDSWRRRGPEGDMEKEQGDKKEGEARCGGEVRRWSAGMEWWIGTTQSMRLDILKLFVAWPCIYVYAKVGDEWLKMRSLKDSVLRKLREQLGCGSSLPLVAFYISMWRNNRYLFVKTALVNYVLQVVMECLPSWACRRKLNSKVGSIKIELSHRLVTGRPLSRRLLLEYLKCSGWYALLESLCHFIKNRVSVENQLEARRLILERLLYAEWLELEKLLRHGNLEERIVQDVASTLKVVNHYLPSLFSSVYTVMGELGTLWAKRGLIDWVAVAYPLCILTFQHWSKWIRNAWNSKSLQERREQNRQALNAAISQVLNGIVDIQANNLQSHLLTRFDLIARFEVSSLKTWIAWAIDVLQICGDLNIFFFVFELLCFHFLMYRSGCDHSQQAHIQQHIDQVVYGTKKAVKYFRKLSCIVHAKNDLVQLLHIPNFIESSFTYKLPSHMRLSSVCVSKDLTFRYSADSANAIHLGCELCFEVGKTYIMIGQNASGKSTLAKLLTKFIHPTQGTITWNNISYEHLHHLQLRDWISYVPQQPLMINGTIRENILIGNFCASEQEVIEAAEASGLLDFLRSVENKPPDRAPTEGTETSQETEARAPTDTSKGWVVGAGWREGLPEATATEGSRASKEERAEEKGEDEGVFGRGTRAMEKNGVQQRNGGSTDYGGDDGVDHQHQVPDNDCTDIESSNIRNFVTAGMNNGPIVNSTNGTKDDFDRPANGFAASSFLDSRDEFATALSAATSIFQRSFTRAGVASPPETPNQVSSGVRGTSARTSSAFRLVLGEASSPLYRGALARSNSMPEFQGLPQIRHDRQNQREHDTIQPYSSSSSFFGHSMCSNSLSTTSLLGLFNASVNQDGLVCDQPSSEKKREAEKLSPSYLEQASSLLDQPLEQYSSDFNDGLKQSIALARVFVKKQARFVILDEATSHVDPFKLRTIIFPRLFDFVKRLNMCLLAITHNLLGIQEFDQIIVLHEGKVVYTGTHQGFVNQSVEYFPESE